MSATRRLAAAGILALVAAVVARAQTVPPLPPAASMDAFVERAWRMLADFKGMAEPGPPPPIARKTGEEIRKELEVEIAREYPPERLEAERKAMVAWGLIPPAYDFKALIAGVVSEQLAGYYDPRTRSIGLAEPKSVNQEALTVVHELVHALQDRQTSLAAFIPKEPGRSDQVLARQALIEGEAVALSMEYLLRTEGLQFTSIPSLDDVRSISFAPGLAGPAVRSAPKYLRDVLFFPYQEGVGFMQQLKKRAAWSTVTDLYRDPPRSTAQILHPSKRLGRREDPLVIRLPDLDALVTGVTPVIEDELGEFTLGSAVEPYLGLTRARRAAVGWRGDRHRIWENAAGRFTIVALVAFDTVSTANGFARVWTAMIERRHPHLRGTGFPRPDSVLQWTDGPIAFVIERRGPEVLILERVAGGAVDRIRAAIWKSRP
ncbi:MAG: hypothetical protein HY294_11845 [Candidatus Rokubacteria bacterium]|nr:hypothetical protein [Candidatus Rokubacteria bacterium]MBI3826682.1 hypothetical protein [Candidatus Rokubacteria bacterium]